VKKYYSLFLIALLVLPLVGNQNAFAGDPDTDCGEDTFETIDNGIAAGTVGHFLVEVRSAGDTRCGIVTAEEDSGDIVTVDVIFDWFNYVETVDGAFRLGDSALLGPSLAGGEVTSSGRFLGSNDNMIEWSAVSSIPPGATVMDTVYSFEDATCETFPSEEGPDCTSGVGFARLIQYLDEDVPPFFGNCVLTVRGTAAGGDLELLTIDSVELFGLSQGGAFTPAQGLVNAVFDGWAADDFSDIVDELDSGFVRAVSPTGIVDLADLPFFEHPVLGDSFGPEDVTTMMVWLMDGNTLVTIPTGLGVIPSSSAIPSSTPIGGEIIPIDNVALILVGMQSMTMWMAPVLAGIVGVMTLYLKSRKN